MPRVMVLLYGLACYLVFFATMLYGIGFVGDLVVPKSIDSGPPGPLGQALAVDLLLVALFGLQHSVMARPAFKQVWTLWVPAAVERSTYVLLSSLVLILLYWQWQPTTEVVWYLSSPAGRNTAWALFGLGWVLVGVGSFLISHVDLFGLRQVWLRFRQREYTPLPFKLPLPYRLVRHPMMLGFLTAFWATPLMTVGHLVFAIGMTVYILVATRLEERDLVRQLGPAYADYQRQVPMLLPLPRRK